MAKVLAVASAGGHWEQMMVLRGVLDAHDVHFATTAADLPAREGIAGATVLPDCNRNEILNSTRCLFAALALVLRLRPEVVISTGALPGFCCILIGRIMGARTLWLDSVANAENLSMCGKFSRRVAHVCLTQWDHLATPDGPHYAGSLL